MVPAAAGPPPLTEKEYWRDYDVIRNDVNAAMVACYTHRTINDIAATDFAILEKMNRTPDFWRVTSFSLQSTLFIVLARILDTDDNVHSIYKVLNATTAHPEFFNADALRAQAQHPWHLSESSVFGRVRSERIGTDGAGPA